ncbi:MAG: hypothetical protein ACLQVG_07065 [Terriglobia bacterium]
MAWVARVVVAEVAHDVTQRGNARQFLLATDTERMVDLDLAAPGGAGRGRLGGGPQKVKKQV